MKHVFYALSLSVMFFAACGRNSGTEIPPAPDKEEETTDTIPSIDDDDDDDDVLTYPSTSFETVAQMGVGWNLGNTLDTKSANKTHWGNPEACKELIDAVRAKGFKTLRVPVTWQYNLSIANNYTIQSAYLDRVEEVVNYGLDNGMYVILNIHHDEEIIEPTAAKHTKSLLAVARIWEQVAKRFEDYDDKLIFEIVNEMRAKGTPEEWTGGTAQGRDFLNQYHKTALEVIRKSGEMNAKRQVMVATYAASTSPNAMNGLELPKDNNLIISLHDYFPFNFTMNTGDGKTAAWGSAQDKQAMIDEFDRIHSKFVDNGTPVVIGEWASICRENTEVRAVHAKFFVEECVKRGFVPVWWDNGSFKVGGDGFGLINRHNYEWVHNEIADAIVNAANVK